MNPVISVRGLGKKYRLGATIRHNTLRDQIAGAFKSLFRRNGNLPSDQTRSTTPRAPSPMPHARSDEFWALRDVSFDVQQGEVVGIIGRNGAGKSTLLKILSQITEPTTGEIRVRGRIGSLLEVGTGFHPELSGRENIFLNGAILGMTRDEIKKKFDEIVTFSETERFIDTPVKRYSSGMYVRLAFSVAAHLEPEILLVDEVLAVGDVTFQKKCMGKMDDVSKCGRTLLFVSHNMAAIESLCSRSILLDDGTAMAYGPTLDIITNYLARMNGAHSVNGRQMGGFYRSADSPGLIRRAVLLNSRGEETGQIRVGEACEFRIELSTSAVLHDVAVGLHIQTKSRQRVTSFHTRYQQCSSIRLSKSMTLTCRCPELMLVPGDYVLELAVASSRRVVDRVDHGILFSVIPADVYGTGRIPPLKDGIAVSKAHWEIAGT